MYRRFALTLSVGALFCAALACVQAYAADKSPDVPFSAFRVKPILNLMHEVDTKKVASSVVEVPVSNTKALSVTRMVKPAPKPLLPAPPATQNTIIPIPVPPPARPEAPQAAPQEVSPATQAPRPPVINALQPPTAAVPDESPTASVFVAGIPVPTRKPGREQPPVAVDDMTGGMSGAYVPSLRREEPRTAGMVRIPAEQIPTADMPVEEGRPRSSVRIRDRSRFGGDDDRTAGSLRGETTRMRIPSFGIPGLKVDRLEDAEGVSPVLLPGNTETVAAPDYQGMIQNGGLPHEVVVFFQEKSEELEVGQMDIVNADALAILRANPSLRMEITGFSEKLAAGPDATQKMALARAMMVREYMVQQQIGAQRLTVKGKGDDTDIEPRDRVEMYFSR